ncbi:MAG: MFS transporter, partial [Gammaproteobacteria bacterium]
MGIFSSLNRKQKEAAAILQIGTFLEYFDLMLYVHMSVILNELFFPKTDPHVAQLIAAMSFCSTFVFRPFGALLFGYIGDTFGRKHTVIITTFMMAISCVFMAVLPTYAQIGIIATWGVTLCRIFQGLSSMGEMVGASLYLTELIPAPARYPIVSFLGCADCLGTVAALAVAAGVLVLGLEWRFAFVIGALIATIGIIARTALRETPEFANAKI